MRSSIQIFKFGQSSPISTGFGENKHSRPKLALAQDHDVAITKTAGLNLSFLIEISRCREIQTAIIEQQID
jgi:hypothetical protein